MTEARDSVTGGDNAAAIASLRAALDALQVVPGVSPPPPPAAAAAGAAAGAAAAAAVDPAPVATIVANAVAGATGGTKRKLTIFSSADGVEWLTWRRNAELTVDINGWGVERARREIAAAMEGAAARGMADIKPTPGGLGGHTVKDLLDAFQERFLPEAQSDLSRALFRNARQVAGETVLQWHSRVRELFLRAHPGEDTEASLLLRDQFVLGLMELDVKTWTLDTRPATFTQALNIASNKTASRLRIAAAASGGQGADIPGATGFLPQVKKEPGVGAMARSDRKDLACWYCTIPGHSKKDCNKRKTDQKNGNLKSDKVGPFRGRPPVELNQMGEPKEEGRKGGEPQKKSDTTPRTDSEN